MPNPFNPQPVIQNNPLQGNPQQGNPQQGNPQQGNLLPLPEVPPFSVVPEVLNAYRKYCQCSLGQADIRTRWKSLKELCELVKPKEDTENTEDAEDVEDNAEDFAISESTRKELVQELHRLEEELVAKVNTLPGEPVWKLFSNRVYPLIQHDLRQMTEETQNNAEWKRANRKVCGKTRCFWGLLLAIVCVVIVFICWSAQICAEFNQWAFCAGAERALTKITKNVNDGKDVEKDLNDLGQKLDNFFEKRSKEEKTKAEIRRELGEEVERLLTTILKQATVGNLGKTDKLLKKLQEVWAKIPKSTGSDNESTENTDPLDEKISSSTDIINECAALMARYETIQSEAKRAVNDVVELMEIYEDYFKKEENGKVKEKEFWISYKQIIKEMDKFELRNLKDEIMDKVRKLKNELC